ncbi:sensor histidine kinase [Spirosoma sp. KNUC1025]|uniref:sensor histidine kinase n=1 Tax=Spirosoma sp. KNUC1025 TaxID=2894082 RepID=UPI003864B3E3|nr:histidine kinase [Spirosoma sp. KNUC1025]
MQKRQHQLLTLLLLLSLWSIRWKGLAQAPTLSFQRLTLQGGLATNYSTAFTQDTAGFIWISTVNGLNRFDGLRCLTFTRQPGNLKSLSHRVVRTVFTSRNGTIWVGTQEGLNRFEPATQTFQRFSFAHLGPNSNLIRHITENADGRLWLSTRGGLLQFDPATGKAIPITLPVGTELASSVKAIRRTLIDGRTLWIGTQGGLFAYDLPTKQIRRFQHDTLDRASLPHNYVTSLARNPRTGEIMVGTNSGKLVGVNPKTYRLQPAPQTGVDQPVSALLFTRSGDLWVGINGGGLYHYNAQTEQFATYLNNENNGRSLASNSIIALFEDRAGVVWVATDDAGVCWFNPTVNKFHSLFDEVNYQPVNSRGFDVGAIHIDKANALWLATRDGLVYINPKTRSYRQYRHDPRDVQSLDNNHTFSVINDQRGRVWCGTNTGLNRMDPATGRIEHIPSLSVPDDTTIKLNNRRSLDKCIVGNQVFMLVHAPDGRLFIGTNEKLTIYDPKTDRFTHQLNDPRLRNLPGKNYNMLYFDRHNNLWVSGLGPVYKLSPDLKLLAQYTHDDDPQSLPDDGVTDFAEDRFGRMWVSTDNGLALLNEKTGKFKVFTRRHGLPQNDISALHMVGDTLWLSTSQGLACMDVLRLRITAFDETDGMSSSEFESASVARDSTGRLYFGAMRGLIYASPHQIQRNRYVPPVYLTSFRVNSQELLGNPLAAPAGLTLQHTQNQFTFEMAALNYDNPTENQFAYQLEAFDEKWNQNGNRSFASYTNVPPGDYVLHVIASNNDGVWNRTGYRLPITILAPFWQTWWFRITALFILLGLTAYVARWREKQRADQQREKSELRERIAASEMKALRSQMNPHFLYNSLNAIRLFVLKNDSDNADKYLVKFARLMRLILDNSRQEWVTLTSELEQLSLYLELEQLRFDNLFDFSITTDPDLSLEQTTIPPMIIQPYIENAILHGLAHKQGKGCIQVSIERKADHLSCTVDDNGVGRERAQALKKQSSTHRSVGLRVTEDRLQLIGQRSGQAASVVIIDKYDEDQQSTGTRVIIQLPFISQ